MAFWKRKRSRVVVLGLDGFAFPLLQQFMASGVTPNLQALSEDGRLSQMESVYPTVSNVAWASFQTGSNPGEFGVFGFAELDRDLGLRIPNAAQLRTRTLWQKVSEAGRRLVALGFPLSYPPSEVNGCLVGGFLAPSLEKAVPNRETYDLLTDMGYLIDIDPVKARESIDLLKDELLQALEGRRRALHHFFEKETWDLLCLHVMETDRINHFMWHALEEDGEDAAFFTSFYQKVDHLVGEAAGLCEAGDVLIVLSDHGFCRVKKTVELNRWLQAEGLLEFDGDPSPADPFAAVSPGSRALSLVPGRVHVLTSDFWAEGRVPVSEYEAVRADLMSRLRGLRCPENDEPVCRSVFTREDVYHGAHMSRAPDIVVDPAPGYDLKAAVSRGEMFGLDAISGMHTFEDAFFCIRGSVEEADPKSITEAGRVVERLVLGG